MYVLYTYTLRITIIIIIIVVRDGHGTPTKPIGPVARVLRSRHIIYART